VEDPEAALRQARTKALVRHARAVDAIFDMQERGGKASPAQVKELQEARKVFEEVRPYGSRDVEGAYKKNPELVREVAGDEVLEGISFIPTPGHSIDHASIRLV
jgi:glyoxylase-like metal-dependent hydrolase (beta-lactamase superfamily II)